MDPLGSDRTAETPPEATARSAALRKPEGSPKGASSKRCTPPEKRAVRCAARACCSSSSKMLRASGWKPGSLAYVQEAAALEVQVGNGERGAKMAALQEPRGLALPAPSWSSFSSSAGA